MPEVKTVSPFKYVGSNGDDDGGSFFEAYFRLPDDGIPDSQQELFVKVVTHGEEDPEITFGVFTSNRKNFHHLATGRPNKGAVSRLLYGAARTKTITIIEPIPGR